MLSLRLAIPATDFDNKQCYSVWRSKGHFPNCPMHLCFGGDSLSYVKNKVWHFFWPQLPYLAKWFNYTWLHSGRIFTNIFINIWFWKSASFHILSSVYYSMRILSVDYVLISLASSFFSRLYTNLFTSFTLNLGATPDSASYITHQLSYMHMGHLATCIYLGCTHYSLYIDSLRAII